MSLLIPQAQADQTSEHKVRGRLPPNRMDRFSARSTCAGSGEQTTEPDINEQLRERDLCKNSVAQFNALNVRDGSLAVEGWLSTDVKVTFNIINFISITHPFPLLPLTGYHVVVSAAKQ